MVKGSTCQSYPSKSSTTGVLTSFREVITGSSLLISTSWLQGQQHRRIHEITTTTHVTATTPNLYLSGVKSDLTATITTWVTTTSPDFYLAGDLCSALTTAEIGTKIGVSNNNLLFQTMSATTPSMTSTTLHPPGNDMGDRESRFLIQQVTQLSASLSDNVSINRPVCSAETASGIDLRSTSHASISQRGKAPPVDLFTVKNVKTTFDDWLQTLVRAASWNGWSSEESLMQLAAYLREGQHSSGNYCYQYRNLPTGVPDCNLNP